MATFMHRFNRDIQEIGSRVDHIETKMEEYATTINDLVDAHGKREADTDWLKAKLAEDRSRRNNLKIRGIPESLQQSDLCLYATAMFKALIPSLMDLDITIDRIHHLPKPSHLSEQVPRDVCCLGCTFFHVKEHFMTTMRKQEQIPPQYQQLQYFTDL